MNNHDDQEDNPFRGFIYGLGISILIAAAFLGLVYLWCGKQ